MCVSNKFLWCCCRPEEPHLDGHWLGPVSWWNGFPVLDPCTLPWILFPGCAELDFDCTLITWDLNLGILSVLCPTEQSWLMGPASPQVPEPGVLNRKIEKCFVTDVTLYVSKAYTLLFQYYAVWSITQCVRTALLTTSLGVLYLTQWWQPVLQNFRGGRKNCYLK